MSQDEERTSRSEQTVRLDLKNVAAVMCIIALGCLVITRFDGILSALEVVWEGISPFVYGAIMAYLLNLIMMMWERIWFPKRTEGFAAKIRRPMCIFLSLLTVVLVIVIIVLLVADEVVEAITSLGQGIVELLAVFGIDVSSSFDGSSDNILTAITTLFQDYIEPLLDGETSLADTISSIVELGSTAIGAIVDFFIGLVFAIYLLAGKESAIAGFKRAGHLLLTDHAYEVVSHILTVANQYLSSFFVGQVREGIVLGTLCGIGMAILGLPYAATIGFLVGCGALVPIVGAWTAGILGALIILPVDPIQSLIFIIYLVILQQIDGQLVYPKVVGKSVGIPSIWVFVAVFVGGGLFGFMGTLFGVPIAATIRHLVLEWADARETKLAAKKASEESEPGAAEETDDSLASSEEPDEANLKETFSSVTNDNEDTKTPAELEKRG